MRIQTISKNEKISVFLAGVDIILLVLDPINTFTSQYLWILILTNQQRE
jgi:hypothetical protein